MTLPATWKKVFCPTFLQVQRLLQRDRRELTGVEEIGAGFSAEFDDGSELQGEGGRASTNGAALVLVCPSQPVRLCWCAGPWRSSLGASPS